MEDVKAALRRMLAQGASVRLDYGAEIEGPSPELVAEVLSSRAMNPSLRAAAFRPVMRMRHGEDSDPLVTAFTLDEAGFEAEPASRAQNVENLYLGHVVIPLRAALRVAYWDESAAGICLNAFTDPITLSRDEVLEVLDGDCGDPPLLGDNGASRFESYIAEELKGPNAFDTAYLEAMSIKDAHGVREKVFEVIAEGMDSGAQVLVPYFCLVELGELDALACDSFCGMRDKEPEIPVMMLPRMFVEKDGPHAPSKRATPADIGAWAVIGTSEAQLCVHDETTPAQPVTTLRLGDFMCTLYRVQTVAGMVIDPFHEPCILDRSDLEKLVLRYAEKHGAVFE